MTQQVVPVAPEKHRGDAIATYATTNAHAIVTGSVIDTADGLATFIGYRVAAATAGADVKMQGSIDGSTYVDLTARDSAGAAHSGTEVTIAAAGSNHFFVAPGHDSGVLAAYRFYALSAKSDVADTPSTLTIDKFAK